MKKQVLTLLSFLILLLFLNCKSTNNCVLDMHFRRTVEGPGPDLITFIITSNQKEFEKYIENYGLIEVIFNKKESFKTPVFGITKIKNNTYRLEVSSPYFLLSEYYKDEDIYILFNKSSKMIINITLNGKTFVFKKC